MLSPASLRVCCLAVMAPALTKADRRADCLPVVLPFCVSKTATPENRKDKISSEFNLPKLSNRVTYLFNKRKSYMYKTWFRTYIRNSPEISDKIRLSPLDLRKSLLASKVKLNAETKNKSWHGTNVTLAVADKVRLKYTMNKHNNSIKNMGLARANTSLGLHSMKRMSRITHLTHRDKGNPSTHEPGESSPDLPDSTNLELEPSYRIVRIVQPEQTIGDVSSSADLIISSDTNLTPVLEKEAALPFESSENSDTLAASDNCIPISLPDSAALSDSNVSVTLTDSKCEQAPVFSEKLKDSSVEEKSFDSSARIFSSFASSSPVSCTTPAVNNSASEQDETSEVKESFPVVFSKAQSDCPSSEVPDAAEANIQDSVDHLSTSITLPPSPSDVLEDDVVDDSVPLDTPASPLSIHSPLSPKDSDCASVCGSTSSTLTGCDSPLLSSQDEAGDTEYTTFSHLYAPFAPKIETEFPAPAFSNVSCSTPKSPEEKAKIPSFEGAMHLNQNGCCPLQEEDLSSIGETLGGLELKTADSIRETEILLRQYMIALAHKQMRNFVEYFQKKFSVPCQRQAKNVKNLVHLKAELLQSEDVKNLSTAALVNLVRKLETTASTGDLQNATVQNAEPLPNEGNEMTLNAEDYADLKRKSRIFLTSMKKILKVADPDLTESSDEGSSDHESDDFLDAPVQKRALWKFMKERAALASRSTWLIARTHELENQLRTVTGILRKVSSTVGDLSFEEHVPPESSALSTAGSGDASLQIPVKNSRPKGLGRTVNGYVDHGSISTINHIQQTTGVSESFRLTEHKTNNLVDDGGSCSRIRPLKTSSFQKRKLLITTGLHMTNNKLAKLSTVGCICNCQDEMLPCVLCTGRYNCVQSVDPDSLPLLDRVALLDPNFHPLLSFQKDIPLLLHFENVLKKTEEKYQPVRPVTPPPNHRRLPFITKSKRFSDVRSRSHKLNKYVGSISAKYRNKKHFRKHKLVFGKWKKFQNKSSFQARDRIRRFSVASSGSSRDSPVPSPLSSYDDGYDSKRRRDENQFDIDDVIIPYSSKRGRLVKFEFKDIEIPSWRRKSFDNLGSIDIEEDLSESNFVQRHEGYEVEEKKIIRNGGGALCFFNTWQRRSERQNRLDSRADSSGANTPDPVLLYDQDIVFQDSNSMMGGDPLSPALSPPATPGSANLVSDDSQSAFTNVSGARRRTISARKPEETITPRVNVTEYVEVPPYEPRVFPLSDEMFEELLAVSDHTREDTDVTVSGPSCPASPASTTSSTSTVEEEDVTDPEWTVVKRESGPEQALVLKFAKR